MSVIDSITGKPHVKCGLRYSDIITLTITALLLLSVEVIFWGRATEHPLKSAFFVTSVVTRLRIGCRFASFSLPNRIHTFLLDSVQRTPSAMPRQTLANILSDEIRPSSVPPSLIPSVNKPTRTQSIPPSHRRHVRAASGSQSSKDPTVANSLDLMDLLQRSESSVVKTRSGSVLSRGFILKTDHYPSGVYSFLFVDIVSDITCRSCS